MCNKLADIEWLNRYFLLPLLIQKITSFVPLDAIVIKIEVNYLCQPKGIDFLCQVYRDPKVYLQQSLGLKFN